MFSVLYINIRSYMKSCVKSFEKLRKYLSFVKGISMLWLLQRRGVMTIKQYKFLHCSYQIIHLLTKVGLMVREVEVWHYMCISLNFKIPKKQSINTNNIERAVIQITKKTPITLLFFTSIILLEVNDMNFYTKWKILFVRIMKGLYF